MDKLLSANDEDNLENYGQKCREARKIKTMEKR